MERTEQGFARVYARLLSRLDPDPARSEQAFRSIRQALSKSDAAPKKKRGGSSNSEEPVI